MARVRIVEEARHYIEVEDTGGMRRFLMNETPPFVLEDWRPATNVELTILGALKPIHRSAGPAPAISHYTGTNDE